ncbi:hypothetical protein [Xanthomonas sacchari]|uniref:hypothetical protein n=1 Tax=Xanthomonas sacchari TaxID=56458 RepID=UPI00225E12DA|nr:hypothetical protein [Xanthomonas sacchari]
MAAAIAFAVAVVSAVVLLLLHRVPSAAAELAGKTPRRGAAHKDVRRFRPGQDAPSENPASGADPRSGREGGVCFLLVTFLCTSKEK